MKAVLIRQFGPPGVMKIEEVEKPVISRDRLLVRIFYSSVNPVDWKIRNGSLRLISGSRFPMMLGFDIAGEVVDTGSAVTRFKKGDRVFGMLDFRHRGAYAEYACANEAGLALIPETLDFKEAAAIPLAALTAYQALHYKGRIKNGKTVLINGASGGVGSFAVQIAKASGAAVTAICGTHTTELVKKLGADSVIDYTKHDFRQFSDTYDIIFDVVAKHSFFEVSKNLRGGGYYVTTLPNKPADILSFVLTFPLSFLGLSKRSTFISVRPNGDDLHSLSLLVKEGKIMPLIDREYTLEEINQAHAYSEKGHARGKILIRVS
ncbi:MAG TPA: NAD(P)-dependent alcohol dehydrogenase [Thermodesulfovibrionales bacterium]|nr:NAD(P)-dependent alcohol dehydrogenase [Thermodesulfovibrionales bacterium]